MSNVQLEQMKSLVTALHAIKERMDRSKGMFPSHHEHLERRYAEIVQQARDSKIVPPWLAA